MKKIGLIQPNFQQGPAELNAYYLPYSIGSLWAYALTSNIVRENYELVSLQWKREQISIAVSYLSDCDVVGFSTYVWNRNYNYALARAIKEINPKVVIIFGGPEPDITNPDIFKIHPFIDVVVKGEGEVTFTRLLESIINDSILLVSGLLVNDNLIAVNTGESPRIDDLSILPSPYKAGIFDALKANNPDIEWNSTLETNRGCPYMCTFCDWGSLTYNKVRKFNIDRVFTDLEWMAENK